MSESNFASLNPSLLARKGGAKPAMRSQLGPMPQGNNTAPNLEDLGWNDLGDDGDQPQEADIVQLKPSKIMEKADNAVLRQQEEIVQRIDKAEKAAPQQPKRRSALERGKRAAFTLRLDAERHLKLRLASTICNRSAQQVVTEALDALLGDMPELESLAAQVKRH